MQALAYYTVTSPSSNSVSHCDMTKTGMKGKNGAHRSRSQRHFGISQPPILPNYFNMWAWANINISIYCPYIVYVRTTRAKLAEAISNCCELESNRALFGKVHLLCLYFPLERSYFFLCIFLWSSLAFSTFFCIIH